VKKKHILVILKYYIKKKYKLIDSFFSKINCLFLKDFLLLINIIQGIKAYKYFYPILYGLLHCVWSFESEWINLLGSIEIWLNNMMYYVYYGFEIWPEYVEHYCQILELLVKKKGPKG
jgi:hypothetical protein